MGKWNELLDGFAKENQYIKLNPPANAEQIAAAERRLGVSFPEGLCELLLELDGDNWFLFSVQQIVETNLMMRELDIFMPLDCLLFFAENGCGDYYGYPIAKDGLNDSRVYRWDHESDDRTWVSEGLEDAIVKYYSDKI